MVNMARLRLNHLPYAPSEEDDEVSAYQDAVTAINMIATNPKTEEVRQELEALRALIKLLTSKLPKQEGADETG
jgi:hypothetical protein